MTTLPTADSITRIFADYQRTSGVRAVAFGVVTDARLTHSGGIGCAAGSSQSAASTPDADSVFRIASLTKSFTAAAVLLLRDRGLLQLDDPIGKYVPQW